MNMVVFIIIKIKNVYIVYRRAYCELCILSFKANVCYSYARKVGWCNTRTNMFVFRMCACVYVYIYGNSDRTVGLYNID